MDDDVEKPHTIVLFVSFQHLVLTTLAVVKSDSNWKCRLCYMETCLICVSILLISPVANQMYVRILWTIMWFIARLDVVGNYASHVQHYGSPTLFSRSFSLNVILDSKFIYCRCCYSFKSLLAKKMEKKYSKPLSIEVIARTFRAHFRFE